MAGIYGQIEIDDSHRRSELIGLSYLTSRHGKVNRTVVMPGGCYASGFVARSLVLFLLTLLAARNHVCYATEGSDLASVVVEGIKHNESLIRNFQADFEITFHQAKEPEPTDLQGLLADGPREMRIVREEYRSIRDRGV